jgi:hypothetical protein
MVRLWFVYDPFMVRSRFVYGSFMVRLWFVYGSFAVRLWFVRGSFMVRLWFVHGPSTVRSRSVPRLKLCFLQFGTPGLRLFEGGRGVRGIGGWRMFTVAGS